MSDIRRRRFTIFMILTLVAVFAVIIQYGMIMLADGGREEEAPLTLPRVERGPILDRSGRVLAIQTRLYSVTAWLPHIENPRETADLIASILNREAEEIYRNLTDPSASRFQYIQRKVTPSESEAVKKLMEEERLPGISLEPDFGRSYPEKELSAGVIGYVGTDNTGLAGIEYTFNRVLAPAVISDTRSAPREIYGNRVFLTLDIEAQYLVDEIAREAFEKEEPDALIAIVMEARTGEILTMTSLPSFDPNRFQEYPSSSWQNQPIVTTYEPGSVFKVFSVASFLDMGAISAEETFFCDGSYDKEVQGAPDIHINCLGNHGPVDARHILIYSCNAGAGYASEQADSETFYRQLRDLGFGRDTGLPLPGESNGLLSRPEKWSARTKPTLAMGQEIGVSAIQMASAATVFANGGVLLRPHIVKKVVSPQGEIIKFFDREPVREVFSPETAAAVLDMMSDVSGPGGTASLAAVEGMTVAAKTGTAQILDPETGTYSDDAYVASCLGLYPGEKPQLITYVALINPKGKSYFGGAVAAPVVSRIADRLSTHYGIPRDNSPAEGRDPRLSVTRPALIKPGTEIPDFTGASKRQVMPFFDEGKYTLIIRGEGWVVRQSPPPGTPLTEGMTITLELE